MAALILLPIFVSSAKVEISQSCMLSLISLIRMMNSSGARTVPWGTELTTLHSADFVLFTITQNDLYCRKFWIHRPTSWLIPNLFSLWHIIAKSHLSNALL